MRSTLGAGFGAAFVAGCGAALGALARHLVTLLPIDAPWPLLAINLTGCFLMGMLMSRAQPSVFWGTGVLGGFTSYSSYLLILTTLNDAPLTLLYFLLTTLGCLAAWFGGRWFGGSWFAGSQRSGRSGRGRSGRGRLSRQARDPWSAT